MVIKHDHSIVCKNDKCPFLTNNSHGQKRVWSLLSNKWFYFQRSENTLDRFQRSKNMVVEYIHPIVCKNYKWHFLAKIPTVKKGRGRNCQTDDLSVLKIP